MDKDTQITFAVIGVLVVFLGGLAYVLRANVVVPATATTTQKVAQKPSRFLSRWVKSAPRSFWCSVCAII